MAITAFWDATKPAGSDLFETYGLKFNVDNLLEIVRDRATQLSTFRCNYLDINK